MYRPRLGDQLVPYCFIRGDQLKNFHRIELQSEGEDESENNSDYASVHCEPLLNALLTDFGPVLELLIGRINRCRSLSDGFLGHCYSLRLVCTYLGRRRVQYRLDLVSNFCITHCLNRFVRGVGKAPHGFLCA